MSHGQAQTTAAASPAQRDAIERFFGELKSRNDETRQKAARSLRAILEAILRDGPSTEAFNETYRHVVSRASTLVVSGADTSERVGGIYLLTNLIDFRGDDTGQKMTRFSNCFRSVLRGTDTAAMVVAARAMGKLAVPGSPLTAELVDAEVKAALESLQVDRQENRRFAAVLTIRELAQNAPTLLYQYVAEILEVVWVALRDPKVLIRETTAEALSQLIEIVAARDVYFREKWFDRIYKETLQGFRANTVDTVHGSLLAFKELLLKGHMFMQSGTRYQDTCEKIYVYKDARDPLIRREVIELVPILAAYHPAEFSRSYLHKFMIHLQGQLKKEKDRNPAFLAIGKVASAVRSSIDAYMDGILVFIREGLGLKAMIAISVGQTMKKYMDALLDPIFECGLSEPMRQALVDMAHYIPPARQTIQEKLLDLLSQILAGRPYGLFHGTHNGTPPAIPRAHNEDANASLSDAELALALKTLGSFDFSGYVLNEFVHNIAIQYVDNNSAAVRKAAALTCAQLFVKDPIVHQVSRHAMSIVGNVIERLLAVGIADPDPDIRVSVLKSLDARFDRHLAKAQNVRSLFIALNDEVFENREAAMAIIGRLSSVNPAYVFPSLRKVLVQLLTELEYSNTAKSKQQSAQLISHLVNSSSRLIKPYVDPIVRVLVPKTKDYDESVAATAIKAIGDLATIGGDDMRQYLPELMAEFIKNLQNPTFTARRNASLKTMGQLASYSGYVIEPYLQHPDLLPILINIVKTEPAGLLRSETVRLIGILGALDPYKHQQVIEQSPEHNLTTEAQAVTDVSLIMGGLTPSNDEYYPTIVITTLMNILKDHALHHLHQQVFDAVMNIYTSMGLKCVPYLNQVIPGFITVISTSNSPAKTESYFNQLSGLVRIVRQHIRPYLPEILATIRTYWTLASQAHPTILSLIEAIARSLDGEFKVYLAGVLPLMLGVLESTSDLRSCERVLHAFLVFGSSAEEYMHLIIPVILGMIDSRGHSVLVRRQAIETIGKLSRQVNISEFAAQIIQPLVRVIGGSDAQLKPVALETISALIFQFGADFKPFIPTVTKALVANRIPHRNFAIIVERLQKGEPLPQSLSPDEHYQSIEDDQKIAEISTKQLAVNQQHLKSAWEADTRSTREDWIEWMRRLSIELLKESPQQTLRACFPLASQHAPTARALFNSAFISCYTHLFPQYQEELVKSIETALTSNNIPPEILQILLNLAEFMEHDDKALPIDIRQLGQYAGKCHAFAKSLHYKELQFNQEQTPEVVEALISINNALHQYDAAFGILRKAQSYQEVDMRETWFEKLNRWEDALESYQRREREEPYSIQVTMGKMRCLHALGEWDTLASLAEEKWSKVSLEGQQRKIAPLAAAAAWGMGQWEMMDKYLDAMKPESPDRSFFGAIVCIHREQFKDAQTYINRALAGLDTELGALFGESYDRAYTVIVRVQMLAELEEIITYKQSEGFPDRQETMRNTWAKRLRGCQRNVEVWQRMLKVRALVVKPQENMDMWIKFANLCRKSQRYGLAKKALLSLVGSSEEVLSLPLDGGAPHQVNFAILKYMWSAPDGDAEQTLDELRDFTGRLSGEIQARVQELHVDNGSGPSANGVHPVGSFDTHQSYEASANRRMSMQRINDWQTLLAKCYLKQGSWQIALINGDWSDEHVGAILRSYKSATEFAPKWYKAWHAWALANFEVVTSITSHLTAAAAATEKEKKISLPRGIVEEHVVPAIRGFFRSIALTETSSLQDALRLLTLWFAQGHHENVNNAVKEGIASVNIDIWLEVIPQLIARINQPHKVVQKSIHNLLGEVGRRHPQALVYPLTVSMKSDAPDRAMRAAALMNEMKQHSPSIVDAANLVSHELIRIAVLWHEQWHEGLEEASRLFFGDNNIEGMLSVLEPLHRMVDQGPQTLREVSFLQAFGGLLSEAKQHCEQWKRDGLISSINAAWDVYYTVFKKIVRQLPSLMTLELQYVSPRLEAAHDLDLAAPGTYESGKPVIKIVHFDKTATVISSKQRPRRLTLRGSDGQQYVYLLKGHEDIRQDERVMQFFGLVNTLLSNDRECLKRHLNIERFSATPLSTNSGLIGWVPNSDTLHTLIKEYRESRKILLNIEHRIMLQMAPDYDGLALMQKVEVFSYAMDNTTGQDLYRVLWLKSKSSESWLERRTKYIRSLGVMSMVGYILGLGDRHPSNLMLDRITGKIVHIDFGDCFEVAQHRDKYPERVPFRLTRMLTFAMEVSNIEGSFRTICENVMRVMRENKESLMAVLEAFIHDPLLTWRLTKRESPPEPSFPSERRESIMGGQPMLPGGAPGEPGRAGSLAGRPRGRSSMHGARPPILGGASVTTGIGNLAIRDADELDPTTKEVQNARALQVLARVKEKLTGTDFHRRTGVPGVGGQVGPGLNGLDGEDETLGVGPSTVDTARRVSATLPMAGLGPPMPLTALSALPVEEQVERLISEATSLENLCQHFVGWCSFW